MPQLFKPRSNPLYRLVFILSTSAAVGALLFSVAWKWSDYETEVDVSIMQPVPFSHKHHVGGLGLDCRYCHASVEKTAQAGMPSTHTCMTCHSQVWQNAPMLEPVRESEASGQPIPWQRVNRLPQYVYFDHSIHVNQGVGCTTCHGEVAEMPLTSKKRSFYMRDCLSCHREPERYLRPRELVFDAHWQAPPDQIELGARLVAQYHIPKQRLTDCVTCHR